jgi:hypothetical protein
MLQRRMSSRRAAVAVEMLRHASRCATGAKGHTGAEQWRYTRPSAEVNPVLLPQRGTPDADRLRGQVSGRVKRGHPARMPRFSASLGERGESAESRLEREQVLVIQVEVVQVEWF